MGCSCDRIAALEANLETIHSKLDDGDVQGAKDVLNRALTKFPKRSVVVGTIVSLDDTGRFVRGPPPLSLPVVPTNSNPMPGSAGSGSNPLRGPSQSEQGASGSVVFPKVASGSFHEALEILRFRLSAGALFLAYRHTPPAEEQFLIAQAGAAALKSTANEDQMLLATEVWINACLGVCRVALLDAEECERHSASTHDKLCGFVLSQSAALRPVVTQLVGVGSEVMAEVLQLEAQAHGARRNYRSALFCAQRACGITATRYGIGSPERKKTLEMVEEYKSKLLHSAVASGPLPTDASADLEDDLENISSMLARSRFAYAARVLVRRRPTPTDGSSSMSVDSSPTESIPIQRESVGAQSSVARSTAQLAWSQLQPSTPADWASIKPSAISHALQRLPIALQQETASNVFLLSQLIEEFSKAAQSTRDAGFVLREPLLKAFASLSEVDKDRLALEVRIQLDGENRRRNPNSFERRAFLSGCLQVLGAKSLADYIRQDSEGKLTNQISRAIYSHDKSLRGDAINCQTLFLSHVLKFSEFCEIETMELSLRLLRSDTAFTDAKLLISKIDARLKQLLVDGHCSGKHGRLVAASRTIKALHEFQQPVSGLSLFLSEVQRTSESTDLFQAEISRDAELIGNVLPAIAGQQEMDLQRCLMIAAKFLVVNFNHNRWETARPILQHLKAVTGGIDTVADAVLSQSLTPTGMVAAIFGLGRLEECSTFVETLILRLRNHLETISQPERVHFFHILSRWKPLELGGRMPFGLHSLFDLLGSVAVEIPIDAWGGVARATAAMSFLVNSDSQLVRRRPRDDTPVIPRLQGANAFFDALHLKFDEALLLADSELLTFFDVYFRALRLDLDQAERLCNRLSKFSSLRELPKLMELLQRFPSAAPTVVAAADSPADAVPMPVNYVGRILEALAPWIIQNVQCVSLVGVAIAVSPLGKYGGERLLHDLVRRATDQFTQVITQMGDVALLVGLALALTLPGVEAPQPLLSLLQSRIVSETGSNSLEARLFIPILTRIRRARSKSAGDWLSRVAPALKLASLQSTTMGELLYMLRLLADLEAHKVCPDILQAATSALTHRWNKAPLSAIDELLPLATQIRSQPLLNLCLSKSVQHATRLPEGTVRNILKTLLEAKNVVVLKAFIVGARPRMTLWIGSTDVEGCLLIGKCLAAIQSDMCKSLIGESAKRLKTISTDRAEVREFLEQAAASGSMDNTDVAELAKSFQFKFSQN